MNPKIELWYEEATKEWRADLFFKGLDYHAVGKTPGQALVRLGQFYDKKQT